MVGSENVAKDETKMLFRYQMKWFVFFYLEPIIVYIRPYFGWILWISHIKDLWTNSMLPISIVKAKYKYFQIQAFIMLFRVKSILNAQAGVLPVFCYQTKVTDAYCLKKLWKTFRPIIKSSKIILVHIVYGLSSFSEKIMSFVVTQISDG